MDKALKGLLGSSGDPNDSQAGTERARDFVRRVTEGPRDQGYETQEAVQQLDQVLPHANSAQVQRATQRALADLPEDQRAQFGQFVDQLGQRSPGGRAPSGNGFSLDDLASMFGQAGGPANSTGDLFGGLFGGGGNREGGVGDVLGGLFGGGTDPRTSGRDRDSGGFGDSLGSGVGKMVLGGIAAYLTKELLDGRG